LTSAATLPPPDTGSHAAAASSKTRANTKSGVGPAFNSDVLLAKVRIVTPSTVRRSDRSGASVCG
jgi:hypothetical protein